MKFVIARNVSKRPTLQHAVETYRSDYTLCGYLVAGWSRAFSDEPIMPLLCIRCRKITGVTENVTPISKARKRKVG